MGIPLQKLHGGIYFTDADRKFAQEFFGDQTDVFGWTCLEYMDIIQKLDSKMRDPKYMRRVEGTKDLKWLMTLMLQLQKFPATYAIDIDDAFKPIALQYQSFE